MVEILIVTVRSYFFSETSKEKTENEEDIIILISIYSIFSISQCYKHFLCIELFNLTL